MDTEIRGEWEALEEILGEPLGVVAGVRVLPPPPPAHTPRDGDGVEERVPSDLTVAVIPGEEVCSDGVGVAKGCEGEGVPLPPPIPSGLPLWLALGVGVSVPPSPPLPGVPEVHREEEGVGLEEGERRREEWEGGVPNF